MISIEFLRQFRIFEFAVFDLALAFLGVLMLSPLLSWIFKKCGIHIPKRNWIFLTLPMSIVIHIAVGHITPLTRNFIDLGGHYFLKILIICLIILGMRGIKRIKNTQDKSDI